MSSTGIPAWFGYDPVLYIGNSYGLISGKSRHGFYCARFLG